MQLLRRVLPGLLLLIIGVPLSAQTYCGTEPDAKTLDYLAELNPRVQAFTRDYLARESHQMIEVPIQAHITRSDTGAGGITLLEYEREMMIVNELYAPAGIRFVDCAPPMVHDDDEINDWEISDEFYAENTYSTPNVINLYIPTILPGLCGYTRLPGNGNNDIVVVRQSCFTNGSTTAHELGHYFGLYHTHGKVNCGTLTDERVDGSNCETTGDDVCDTPADPNLQDVNCNRLLVSDSCTYIGNLVDSTGTPYRPDVRNIMSYSRDFCQDTLTPGQLARALFFLETERDYLLCDSDVVPPNLTCAEAFSVECFNVYRESTINVPDLTTLPNCGAATAEPRRGLWYSLIGNNRRTELELCGSRFNTQIFVFSGSCDTLDCVAQNDDACSGRGRVEFYADEGVEYLIFVGNGEGSTGTGRFTLSVSCASESCPPPDISVVNRTDTSVTLSWPTSIFLSSVDVFERIGFQEFPVALRQSPPARVMLDSCRDQQLLFRSNCRSVRSYLGSALLLRDTNDCTYCPTEPAGLTLIAGREALEVNWGFTPDAGRVFARLRPSGGTQAWRNAADDYGLRLTGLAPCTEYEIQFRLACNPDTTDWSSPRLIQTTTNTYDVTSEVRLDNSTEALTLTLTDEEITGIEWYTEVAGQETLIGTGLTQRVALGEPGCGNQTFVSRYVDTVGCGQSESFRVATCAPRDCAMALDSVLMDMTDTVIVSVDSELRRVRWLVDGDSVTPPASSSPNGLSLRVPPGTVTMVCATSYNPATETYQSCCRDVDRRTTSARNLSGPRQWKVYPNPTAATVFVDRENGANLATAFTLYDANGRRVLGGQLTEGRFSVRTVAAGVYFLRLSSRDDTQVVRLVVR